MKIFLTVLKWLGLVLLFVVLTYVTQVGGLLLLLFWPISHFAIARLRLRWQRLLARGLGFPGFYLLFSLAVVPPLASLWGRVPLHHNPSDQVQALNLLTPLLNRDYVSPRMQRSLEEISISIQKDQPGTVLAYMDAQFPFPIALPFIGKSLPPHLTHNDGNRADIALLYQEQSTGKALHRSSPTWIGYGAHVLPLPGERNRPAECAAQGFWQYNFMSHWIPQDQEVEFSTERNRDFLRTILRHPQVSRIYLEPHLVQRLGLTGPKVKMTGCKAVRHDDHVHIETR